MSTSFNAVPVFGSNRFATMSENRNGKNTAQITSDKSSATSSAGAVTIRAQDFVITTESLTTAAGAVYTLTVTNSAVTASSSVFVSVDAASSAGTPVVTSVTPAAGSVVIKVQNVHASAAFNNSIKLSVRVL